MKINIITRHAIANYGSLLQAYATQNFFNNLGFTTGIIDYIPESECGLKRVDTYASLAEVQGLKRIIYKTVKAPDELVKGKKFNKYRKSFLNLTQRYSTLKQLQDANFGDSILCAGSDQLWGYMPTKKIDEAYFLNFGTSKNKFIAYSASFGRTDFNDEFYNDLPKLLSKFSFITVRETSAKRIIEEKTPFKAEAILDPTLMMSREFWINLANKKVNKCKYILLYQLRSNKLMDEYVKKFAKQQGLKIYRLTTSIYDYLKCGKTKCLKAPDKMLALFRDAQFVVTDSFHATVFSVIFNKQFVDILPPTTHERITDFLDMLQLNNRIVNGVDDKQINSIVEPIDYTFVNAELNQIRQEKTNLMISLLNNL